MTQTEKLLNDAEELARRSFEFPSQETVMQLFSRLCDEADIAASFQEQEPINETLH